MWQHLSVARVAEGLGVAWKTANDAVLAEGKRMPLDDPHVLTASGSWASTSMCGGPPGVGASTSR